MTFLNPLVLFGLVAAAIPVILHLLNLRKLRTIEFSTLAFLKELQQTKIRRLKLRQLILLIVRTLLVIFIVIAFARPTLRGTIIGGIGSHANSTIAIIFDDSFSMQATDERGEFFKQAKDAAAKTIDLLNEGDEVFLIRLSDLPKATINPATHDLNTLRTVINESGVSAIRRPLNEALVLAGELLQTSSNANKEVYIISDMQRSLFTNGHSSQTDHALPRFPEGSKIFFLPIGSKSTANVSLDSVAVTTIIVEKEKPVTIRASVRNFSDLPLTNYVVSAYLDGVKAAQRNLSLDPWGSAAVEMSVVPKRSGFLNGYVELENDAIETDNRRYFAVYVPDRIDVLVVASTTADVHFVQLALTATREDGKSASEAGEPSLLNVQQVAPQRFSQVDLKSIEVIVWVLSAVSSTSDAKRLRGFVERGGGLILFPGSDAQRNGFNSLLTGLDLPPVDKIASVSSQQAGQSFAKIDFNHPLFTTMFETDAMRQRQTNQTLESPTILKSIQWQAGKRARTVISLDNGSPFLAEYTLGDGIILFYAVSPVLSWSDFPVKGLFAPLVYRSVVYASPREESTRSYTVGSEPNVSLRGGTQRSVSNGATYTLISPNGAEELIQPQANTGQRGGFNTKLSFRLTPVKQTGIYDLQLNGRTLTLIPVNADNRESDTRKVTDDELETFWNELGIDRAAIQTIQPGDRLHAAILQSRFGVELWKFCVGIALLLALLEMLIARDSRSTTRREGTATGGTTVG